MVEIIFIYNHIETIIQSNEDDSFNSVIEKYINKSQLDINNINFISDGKIISKNGKIKDIMNNSEKINKKKIILVLSINSTINNDNTNMIQSKDVICPKCKEICKYNIKNSLLKVFAFELFLHLSHIICDISIFCLLLKSSILILSIICPFIHPHNFIL